MNKISEHHQKFVRIALHTVAVFAIASMAGCAKTSSGSASSPTTSASSTTLTSAPTTTALGQNGIRINAIGDASSNTQNVVIIGAIADAGTLDASAPVSTIKVSKGTITVDLRAGAKAETALFSHLSSITNPKTCGVDGSYRAVDRITGGTGAYAGITGSVDVTTIERGVFPKTASGACDLSDSATPIGFLSISDGVGTVNLH